MFGGLAAAPSQSNLVGLTPELPGLILQGTVSMYLVVVCSTPHPNSKVLR